MRQEHKLVGLELAGSIASGREREPRVGRNSSKSYTDDQWGEAGSLIAHISSQLYSSVLRTAPYYCGLCVAFAYPFLFLFNYLNHFLLLL